MSRLNEIDAYLTGELDDAAAAALEEALFDAPDDPDLAFFDRLATHGARLLAHHTFHTGVTRAQIDALIAAGHDVQVIDAGPPGPTRGWINAAKSELIVTRLALGRPDLERVDVEITLPEHGVTKTIVDVIVDRTDGALYGLCERPLAEMAFGAGEAIARVRTHDGQRTVIAEWQFTSAP